MLKKVVIAGLAVVVGVVVLAWISPPLFDWVIHQGKAMREGAENAIPPEQQIDILRDKVKDLDKNKQKLVDTYGAKAMAVTETQKEVDKLQGARDSEMARIDAFTKDLSDTTKVSFDYKGGPFSRAKVKAQLEAEFQNLKIADSTLDAKKELLEARKSAKDAAWNAVCTFNEQRDKLAAELDKMEAKLAAVRAREAASAEKVSDNDMATLGSQIDDLNKRIEVKRNAADASTALQAGPINPLPDPTADSKDDILKQIHDYKAAKNGEPKLPEVVDVKK